jgi:5-methylcytosine-specific restriction protein A
MNGFGRVFASLDLEKKSRIAQSESLKAYIFIRAQGKCQHCSCALVFLASGKAWQIDHCVPMGAGGSNTHSNLQALCTPCHKKKNKADLQTARTPQGMPIGMRHAIPHWKKDEAILLLQKEVARLKAVVARYAQDEEGAA